MIFNDDYSMNPAKHCLYGSLYNLFHKWGSKLHESDFFFLCNGMLFSFEQSDSVGFIKDVLTFIKLDYRQQVERCAKMLSMSVLVEENGAIDWQGCIRALKEGFPVLAFVDSSVLKYHVLENPLPNLGAHTLLLNDVNINTGQISFLDSYVIDNSGNAKIVRGNISYQSLRNTARGLCFFSGFDKSNEPDIHMMASCFHDSIKQYLQPDQQRLSGHSAMINIMKNLKRLLENHEDEAYKNMIALVFLCKAYITSTLDYIEEAAERYVIGGQAVKKYLIEEIISLKQEWNVFYLRCLTIDTKKESVNSVNIERTILSGISVVEHQKNVYSELISCA